jgi:hypothetical protein
MNKTLITCLVSIFTLPMFSQEALLSEILNVQPVEYSEAGSEEMQAEYQAKMDEEKARTDEALAKLDEDYKKEVAGHIEDFNKVLEEPDEKAVANMKKSLKTIFTTLTMNLKKNKKDAAINFKNMMVKEIRELPGKVQIKKEKEVDDIRDEYFATFEKEYVANMDVLTTFMKTEHLVKKAEVSSN